MITESKVTEFFFVANNFCKEFEELSHGLTLVAGWPVNHEILNESAEEMIDFAAIKNSNQ